MRSLSAGEADASDVVVMPTTVSGCRLSRRHVNQSDRGMNVRSVIVSCIRRLVDLS
jgi:hypothetical protein